MAASVTMLLAKPNGRRVCLGLGILAAPGLVATAGLSSPQQTVDPRAPVQGDEVVVKAMRPDIVVSGSLPRCVRRPGDPMDAVDVSHQMEGQQMAVLRDPKSGGFRMMWDNDPIGGSDWQRAGTGLRSYVFRAPEDGNPLCIGARSRAPHGFAQLRRIVDATPFRGKGVRFSGYVVSNRGADIRFWLAAGKEARGVVSGNSDGTVTLNPRKGWQVFAYEIPFVPENAWSISYGFLLWGPGDVWVTDPRLEAIPARGRNRDLYAKPLH